MLQHILKRSTVVALPVLAIGCLEQETVPPARTTAAIEHGLRDEQVGVTSSAPVRSAPPQFDDADADSIRLFYDVLASYGKWTDDARLGLVWIPAKDSVPASFVPYGTNGRWTHREVIALGGDHERTRTPFQEYVWVSDLPWGWVTFHYGRWAYTGDRGWAWIAGRRYSGAWVDWRTPHDTSDGEQIIGWAPTPPQHVWRISPGPRPTRARSNEIDIRTARLVAIPYSAFATPYTYTRTRDLFSGELGNHLFAAQNAMAVAHATDPGVAPSPRQLGLAPSQIPQPPQMDRGLQQAWMLASPASAMAVGMGPELGPPPRLRTWVAGGRYASFR